MINLTSDHIALSKVLITSPLGHKRHLHLCNLLFNPDKEDMAYSKALGTLKRIKAFFLSIMNEQEAYVIDKKVAAEPEEDMRRVLSSLAHKELIYLVIDFQAFGD